MASFPEEPLNKSAAEGFGYFPANIGQTLNEGRYTIIRKLGWGPRSSVWLVTEQDEGETVHWAAQIFTAAKTPDAEARLLPVLQNELARAADDISFPNFRNSFKEKSVHGEHLCLIISEYGLPFSNTFQAAISSGRAGLPVHVVQKVTSEVIEVLQATHNEGVLHSGIKLENIAFWPSTVDDELEEHLTDNPPAPAEIINDLPVVRSQPISNYTVEWNEPMSDVADWMLVVAGFGHIQASPYSPEPGFDYSSAPETLLANPTLGLSTDIWMLGSLIFQLLTGKPLVSSTGTPAERLAEIRDTLQTAIPKAWSGDATVQSLPAANTSTPSLEQRLKEALTETEASSVLKFLRTLLVIDPEGRVSAEAVAEDAWVEEGGQCSCGFH